MQEDEYIHPLIYRERDTLIAKSTYHCWQQLMRRGWWLTTLDDDAFMAPRGEQARALMITLEIPSRMEAELSYLASIEAIFPQPRRAIPDWELPTPRPFRAYDLSPGVRDRCARALYDIRVALRRSRRPYIAFSGGKDSTALLLLVHAADPAIPLMWADDELEFPESLALMERTLHRFGSQFRIVQGGTIHGGWFRPWCEPPYWREPLPAMEWIGRPMDEWARDAGFDLTFLGLRADESKGRAKHLLSAGPIYRRRNGLVCCPLWDWNEAHVWDLIRAAGADYNAAYDRYEELGLNPSLRRVGPLPLAPRSTLAAGWPDLLARLEDRYGPRW